MPFRALALEGQLSRVTSKILLSMRIFGQRAPLPKDGTLDSRIDPLIKFFEAPAPSKHIHVVLVETTTVDTLCDLMSELTFPRTYSVLTSLLTTK